MLEYYWSLGDGLEKFMNAASLCSFSMLARPIADECCLRSHFTRDELDPRYAFIYVLVYQELGYY
jgi:hypothetical protein